MTKNIVNKWLLVSGFLLLAISWQAWGEDDHERSRRLVEGGKILSLQQVLGQNGLEKNGRVLEVELELERGRYIYEIELLTEDGRVWEYEIDAANGEILERELED
jgi:uncharacterized membrane protein YkoI